MVEQEARMRRTLISTEESQSQKYKRLVENNPARKVVDENTQNIVIKKLASKTLTELHKIVGALQGSKK